MYVGVCMREYGKVIDSYKLPLVQNWFYSVVMQLQWINILEKTNIWKEFAKRLL